jgi:hypothetical protein
MITNNFKKILTMCIFSSEGRDNETPKVPASNLPTLISTDGVEKIMKTTSGNYTTQMMNSFVNVMNHLSTNGPHNTLYLKVGTGTTTPTEDDYELATVNTDISCDTIVVGNSVNYTKTYTATFSNPTSSDITVTEVGLYGNIQYINNSQTTEYTDCMFDRTVLTTPITIPAGESKAITYELGF